MKKRKNIYAENLYEQVKHWDYGTEISHQDLQEIIGAEWKTPQYSYAISEANKWLLKNGKRLVNIHNVGYRLLKPDEFTQEANKHVTRASNATGRAIDISLSAPVEYMSEEARQTHRYHSDRLRQVHASMSGAKTELSVLAKQQAKRPFNQY